MNNLYRTALVALFALGLALSASAQEATGDCENCYECLIGLSVVADCQASSSAPFNQQEGCTLKVQNANDCRTHFTSCRGTDNSCLSGGGGPIEEGGFEFV